MLYTAEIGDLGHTSVILAKASVFHKAPCTHIMMIIRLTAIHWFVFIMQQIMLTESNAHNVSKILPQIIKRQNLSLTITSPDPNWGMFNINEILPNTKQMDKQLNI